MSSIILFYKDAAITVERWIISKNP